MIHDIKYFYAHSRGRMVLRLLKNIIKIWWPHINHLRVTGFGYPQPFLNLYKKDDPETLSVLMNKTYTHHRWPLNKDNLMSICEDAHIPLESQSIDRILMVHGLETSPRPKHLLSEMWRILDGDGRMIIIVPNRAGMWARAEHTPFGQGHPYSLTQLSLLLNECGFSVERSARALYAPSGRSRFLISTAALWEKVGAQFFTAFGGVIVVEVSKQLFTPTAVVTDTEKRQMISQPVAALD